MKSDGHGQYTNPNMIPTEPRLRDPSSTCRRLGSMSTRRVTKKEVVLMAAQRQVQPCGKHHFERLGFQELSPFSSKAQARAQ